MLEYLVVGLASLAQGSSSAPTQVDWHWQSDDEGCVLAQQLEQGNAQFEIARTPGNDAVRITVIDWQGASREWKPIDGLAISLDNGGRASASGFVGPGKKPGSRMITLSTTDGKLLEQLAGASAITLSGPRVGTVRIVPRSTAAAIKALGECEDRKMRKWGIDPTAWRQLPVKPTPKTSPSTWIDWFDYPARDKNYRNDIMVVARLDLGADGNVQNCQIVNSPPVEFREAACSALRRKARMEPARDATGQPIPAPFVLQIRFGAFKI